MTDSPKPKRFIVTLTGEQRAKLEQYRGDHRLKSEADAVRHWLDGYASRAETSASLEAVMKAIRDAPPGIAPDRPPLKPAAVALPVGPPPRAPGSLQKTKGRKS